MATYDTWNPSDKAAGATLSLANLKVTSSSTYSNVRSALSKAAGKWYFEVTVNVINTGGAGVGKSTANLTGNPPGLDANSWAFLGDGVYNNGVKAFSSSITTNDVINVAIDIDAGKLWFGKNGTWLNSGDPAAGTGACFTGLSGTFYGIGGGGNTTAVTANFGGAAFAYTVPTGFNPGWFIQSATTLTATPLSYALTLVNAFTKVARRMAATPLSYAFSLVAATLRYGRNLIATPLSFALTLRATIISKFAGSSRASRAAAFVLQKLRTTDPSLDQ